MNASLLATSLACLTSAAVASPQITYRFGDLNADYMYSAQTSTGTMSINAVANTQHFSNGDMTRLDEPGTAEFDPGFADLPIFQVSLNLSVTGITAASALGAGQLSITDADGDTLTADLAGVFNVDGMFTFFDAASSNFIFAGPGSTIDGTTGSMLVDDLLGSPLAGAASFVINSDSGGLLSDFSSLTATADGVITPAPAAFGCLALGMGVAGRRRRG